MGTPRKKVSKAPPGSMGQAVHDERLRLGWTQVELARLAKVGQSQVSMIESKPSDQIRAFTVFRVAEAFACDPLMLFRGKIVAAAETPRALFSKEAHRLEQLLNEENMGRWIGYGTALLDGQPKTELKVIADVREKSRKKRAAK